MRDIIVTTPQACAEAAALEAAESIQCIQEGGEAWYFRNLGLHAPRDLEEGDRCFYVEEGYVRGFATVSAITWSPSEICQTTGRHFGQGVYACMDARSWKWIEPIPMRGFQGYRYSRLAEQEIVVVGRWLDPKPATS